MVNEFALPSLIYYRRGWTIGSQVTKAQTQKEIKLRDIYFGARNCGMYPCLNCKQCRYVIKGKFLEHPGTVYAIVCPCGKIYVGEMVQKVKSHISQYRSTINGGNMTLPLSKDFKEKGHTAEQLKLTILEVVPPLKRGGDSKLKLKPREVWWINKLNTLHPPWTEQGL
ncbi:hypothetical protein XELAEV_18022582mg [Xenopus laevis]|uniref:GIY-YIG domain-containing protein n=1 Tax=Xenopus laevis TaxID=8355 RepID=A0A974D2L0_XENLA|nr:hypothetical protein XELAEV_18022582mg [Xenopus laevis]